MINQEFDEARFIRERLGVELDDSLRLAEIIDQREDITLAFGNGSVVEFNFFGTELSPKPMSGPPLAISIVDQTRENVDRIYIRDSDHALTHATLAEQLAGIAEAAKMNDRLGPDLAVNVASFVNSINTMNMAAVTEPTHMPGQ